MAVVVAVLACEGVGVLAGIATQTSVDTWYPTLTQPWFTPPDWLFAPVWIVLYALIGIAAARVWRRLRDGARPRPPAIWAVFGGQMGLNLAWSVCFFGLQSPLGGLVVIALLWTAIVGTIERFARVDSVAAGLLVPYLLWVTYAAALNGGIVVLN